MCSAPRAGIAAMFAALVFAIAPSALADTGGEPDAAGEAEGDGASGDAVDVPLPAGLVFPDPVLMKRARTYRGVGATLSIAGAVAAVVSFNVALAVIRSGDEQRLQNMRAWAIPLGVVTGVGLQLGGPLWSVGGEMHRQLTRNTRGDEKLRREVANDSRYWQGRTMNAFGTSMALTGGLSVAVGSLLLVGGIWVVDGGVDLADAGVTVNPNYIGVPILVVGAGAALLVSGLEIRKAGLTRSERVREAYATSQLMPIPYIDPLSRSGGLVLAGTF